MHLLSAVWLAIAVAAISLEALAGPPEDEAFAAFEWFCLNHVSKPEKIPGLFETLKIKPLPRDAAAPLIAPHTGQSWLLKGTHARMIISVLDTGGCTTMAPDADSVVSVAVFEANSRNRKLADETVGSEKQLIYAVSTPDSQGGDDHHAVVLITVSNLKSLPGIVYNALPEALVKSGGMTVPSWP